MPQGAARRPAPAPHILPEGWEGGGNAVGGAGGTHTGYPEMVGLPRAVEACKPVGGCGVLLEVRAELHQNKGEK